MKTLQFIRTLAIATLLGGAPLPLFAQGPLNPPGPPAPMMKTLVEMEPRTHIVSLPYTITASGSYYLTNNLNGGGTAAGIIIQASGVTIDLRGFSIENCISGISAAGAGVTDVAIHNGIVRGCAGAGIDLGVVAKVRLEGVILTGNGGDGAGIGPASLVTLCTAKENGLNGLVVGDGGKVFQCVTQSNGGNGIAVASTCQVSDNNCNLQAAGAGIATAGNGNRVEGNSCNQNKYGFQINGTGNLVIRNNACSNGVSDYSVSTGNNYGQILTSPGAGFVNSNAWANFGCGTPNNGTCAVNVDCDDGNNCTTDVCQASACIHTAIAGCGGGGGLGSACMTAADCNDGNACTTDVCQGGTCVAGPLVVCDDGNACTTDTCNGSTGCTYTPIPGCGTAVCGDGIVQAGEACDDGNLVNGDGCSSSCQLEACSTTAQCPGVDTDCQMRTCTSGTCGFTFAANGTPVTNQVSGDCKQLICNGAGGTSNTVNNSDLPNDGNQCTTDTCVAGNPVNSPSSYGTACAQYGGTICNGVGVCISNAICGDGIVQAGESCDDGNTTNGDGCTATCSVQSGFTCAGSPSVCTSVCGDGLVAAGESCDDGNNVPGDGCSAVCSTEVGFTCVGSPSACTAVNYALTTSKTGTGSGSLTSSPAGINCGATCSGNYSYGTVVTLTAAPQAGSSFTGWSGACSGMGTCTLTMTSAKSVNANFSSAP